MISRLPRHLLKAIETGEPDDRVPVLHRLWAGLDSRVGPDPSVRERTVPFGKPAITFLRSLDERFECVDHNLGSYQVAMF
jgi:hypothetical protein